jgi:hypothetical protein
MLRVREVRDLIIGNNNFKFSAGLLKDPNSKELKLVNKHNYSALLADPIKS